MLISYMYAANFRFRFNSQTTNIFKGIWYLSHLRAESAHPQSRKSLCGSSTQRLDVDDLVPLIKNIEFLTHTFQLDQSIFVFRVGR